jgi:hypothetical protein
MSPFLQISLNILGVSPTVKIKHPNYHQNMLLCNIWEADITITAATFNPISHWLGPCGHCLLLSTFVPKIEKNMYSSRSVLRIIATLQKRVFFAVLLRNSNLYLKVRFKRTYAAISLLMYRAAWK